MNWSPISKLGWPAQLFCLLWTIPTVLILFGWCDDTVVFDRQVIEDDVPGAAELEPDWNAEMRLGDGRCLVVKTREMIEC